MADGTKAAAKPRRMRTAKAPTTADPIEIAMEAVAAGAPPSGVASALLLDHRRLVGWDIADRRAGQMGATGIQQILQGPAARMLAARLGWPVAERGPGYEAARLLLGRATG